MPHEIRRVLRAFAAQPWFIEGRSAERIVALLEYRAAHGPRLQPYREEPAEPRPPRENRGNIAVINLQGPIVPRSSAVDDISTHACSLESFGRAFDQAASSPDVAAIVINGDSPGGNIALVAETAAKIKTARKEGRPIIAVANTMLASAAYWIASACDELVVSPSGEVGSIGAYMLHEDISQMLEMEGVRMTFIQEGPRKTEGNPFEPLSNEAKAALQETVAYHYNAFVKDVAKNRGVSEKIVRADPEMSEKHFGGGRCYPAQTAVSLGMADRVESLEAVIKRLQSGPRRGRGASASGASNIEMRRKRLALI
ncbi:MAG: S49 family peptidase [Anaerolineaceae bacterium]|nr:MAG: S49 family peptidase [Anaerolineaceae bacterium]